MVGSDRFNPVWPTPEEHTMIEDYEHYLAPPPARASWVQRLLAPFRARRPTAAPTNEHLQRDLGLSEEPIHRRQG